MEATSQFHFNENHETQIIFYGFSSVFFSCTENENISRTGIRERSVYSNREEEEKNKHPKAWKTNIFVYLVEGSK